MPTIKRLSVPPKAAASIPQYGDAPRSLLSVPQAAMLWHGMSKLHCQYGLPPVSIPCVIKSVGAMFCFQSKELMWQRDRKCHNQEEDEKGPYRQSPLSSGFSEESIQTMKQLSHALVGLERRMWKGRGSSPHHRSPRRSVGEP